MRGVARCGLRVARALPLRRTSVAAPHVLSRRNCPGNALLATRNFLIALTLAAAPALHACPVCFGAPDDPMVKGMNSGIWVLLGLVGFVQIGFVAMFYSFWRKAREHKRFRESLRVIEGGPHA